MKQIDKLQKLLQPFNTMQPNERYIIQKSPPYPWFSLLHRHRLQICRRVLQAMSAKTERLWTSYVTFVVTTALSAPNIRIKTEYKFPQ